jgi:hypothetical protein
MGLGPGENCKHEPMCPLARSDRWRKLVGGMELRFTRSPCYAGRGLWPRGRQYLALARGVVFHAVTSKQLSIPPTIKTIEADDIWVSFLRAKQVTF